MTEEKKNKILIAAGLDPKRRSYIVEETDKTYEIYDITGDTLGCVLVGENFEDINGDGQYDVTNSRLVMTGLYEKLESMLGNDKSQRFQVKIIDRFPKNETEFL